MNATIHLPRTVRKPLGQDAHLARMRVRIHRAALDRRLAAGEDPGADPDLALRSGQLADPRRRRRIATVLDRILGEAAGPRAPFSSKVPLAHGAILTCAPHVCEIAGRLEGERPLNPRGLAQAQILIRRGDDGPLFSTATTDAALNRHLAGIIDALG